MPGKCIAGYNKDAIQKRSRPLGPTAYPSSFGTRETGAQESPKKEKAEHKGVSRVS